MQASTISFAQREVLPYTGDFKAWVTVACYCVQMYNHHIFPTHG